MDTSEIRDTASILREATEAINHAFSKMKRKEFMDKFFPQRIQLNVKGDGACVPRSISFGLFKDQEHYEIIAKAMNKLNYQFFSQLKKPEEVEPGFFIKPVEVPVKVMVKGEEVEMTEEEWLNFIQTDESIYMYRGVTDMRLLCGLLGIEMSVITVRRDIVISFEEVKPFPQTAHSSGSKSGNIDDRVILVLDVDAQHCQVLVNANKGHSNEDLMEVLENYVGQSVPQDFDDRIAKIQEQMRNFLPRMYKLEKDSKNKSQRIEAVEEDNKAIKQRIKVLEEECKVKDRNIEVLEKRNEMNEHKIDSLEKLATVLRKRIEKEEDGKNECQVEEMSEEENARQCEVLKRQKDKGLERQSPQFPAISRNFPQFSAVEKKNDPMFRCIPCGYEFKTKIELVKHRAALHTTTPDCVSRAVDEAKSFADVVKEKETENPVGISKIPVVTSSGLTAGNVDQQTGTVNVSSVANKRSYNCHECNFNGLNSKNLAKHVRETGHEKHDELRENCYSCGKTFQNFETLMQHRKEVHGQAINKCRYKDKNLCKFGDNCWYSHQDNEVLNVTNKQDFQDGQVTLPPEIKLMITTMMEKAIEIWQEKGSRESNRSQGH